MGSAVSLLFASQLHSDAPPVTWRVPEFMGTIVTSENLRTDHLIPTTAQFTLFAVGSATMSDGRLIIGCDEKELRRRLPCHSHALNCRFGPKLCSCWD